MRRILTILMLAAVSAATAQERFDYIFRRNPWNGGPNAAGIRQDSLSRSYAEIYFTKENGGLTGHSASDDSWNAGAKTESVRLLCNDEIDEQVESVHRTVEVIQDGPDRLDSFDDALFALLVERIIAESQMTIRFQLYGGLEFTETLEER